MNTCQIRPLRGSNFIVCNLFFAINRCPFQVQFCNNKEQFVVFEVQKIPKVDFFEMLNQVQQTVVGVKAKFQSSRLDDIKVLTSFIVARRGF